MSLAEIYTPLSRGLIRGSDNFEPIELKKTPSCCRSCSATFLVVELVQACAANNTAAGSNKSSSEVPGERLNVETLRGAVSFFGRLLG